MAGFLFAVIVAVGYYMDWSPALDELDTAQQEEMQLRESYTLKKRQAINYEAYKQRLVDTEKALAALRPGGRLAIISFHSLEDRLVKRFFRAHEARPDPRLPLRAAELPAQPWIEISPAIRAQASEIAKNPRARSAVLRVATKNPEYCHAS